RGCPEQAGNLESPLPTKSYVRRRGCGSWWTSPAERQLEDRRNGPALPFLRTRAARLTQPVLHALGVAQGRRYLDNEREWPDGAGLAGRRQVRISHPRSDCQTNAREKKTMFIVSGASGILSSVFPLRRCISQATAHCVV